MTSMRNDILQDYIPCQCQRQCNDASFIPLTLIYIVVSVQIRRSDSAPDIRSGAVNILNILQEEKSQLRQYWSDLGQIMGQTQ